MAPLRGGLYPILLSLLILFFIIQSTRLIWTIVTPVGPVGAWWQNDIISIDNDEKYKILENIDPFFRNIEESAENNVITSLDLILFGTRVNENSGEGSAILAGADGVQISYATGDEIAPNAFLFAVKFDHVIIDRGGVKESLYLDQSVEAQSVGGDENSEANSGSDEQNVEFAQVTSAAIKKSINFKPRNINGRINGINVAVAGSGDDVFDDAGFVEGDVITSVNGKKISSPADLAALQNQIKAGARLSIMVERGADVIPVSLNLEE